ncbi:hypothetical protein [Agromyces seonyuensis]|uniref:Alpha/beta hydrolase n=1 Tax=Agromyces seonyuensis TaxID=2662446 RepID=A0A6I4P2P6_9MICO|nr:hypothetical protein [Agromyces seonyuensis]MWB99902.1 hypothetical protein [Agromyces seonyuensis]
MEQQVGTGATAAGPRILELRVHGVHNTKPFELLDLPKEDVRLAAGDALGSFWEASPEARAARVRASDADVDDRGEQTADVHREMYSWGGMVRTTPPDSGLGGKFLAVLARAGWALLLPFSLANAGMWTWQLSSGARPRWSFRSAVIRVFGVLLTLLMAGTAAIVALDVVAMQCFADDVVRCEALPGPIAAMAAWSPGVRVALFSLVPVLAVGGLWWLSSLSRLRYDVADRIVGSAQPGSAPGADDGTSQLTRRAYWLRNGATGRLAMTHFSAATALTAVLLTATWSGADPTAGVAGFWVSVVLLAATLVTAAGTRTMPFERSAPKRPARPIWHGTLLALCVLAWLASAVMVATLTRGCMSGDADASAVESPDTCWSGIAVVGGAELAISGVTVLMILALAVVLVGIMACFPVRARAELPGQSQRRYRAWHGLGPAVFSVCSLALGLIWSSLIAVGIGDWLNGAAGASSLATETTDRIRSVDGADLAVDLDLPALYSVFGVVALALLAVGIVVAVIAVLRPRDLEDRIGAWPEPTERPVVPGPGPVSPSGVPTMAVAEYSGPALESGAPGADPMRPAPDSAAYSSFMAHRIGKARLAAARTHLVEPLAWMLAIGSALALVGSIVVAAALPFQTGKAATATFDAFGPLSDVALIAWGLIAVAVMGGLVLGGDKTVRPLGIVWDVTCFMPRTGHPFGPPCFVERAAPEIASRILWWLDDATQGAPREDRRVVLVAHSMGAVVATCALSILSLHPEAQRVRDRLAFLTFGVQLRPWFGRFFPELLGPDTLGITPCRRPRTFSADPWGDDFTSAAAPSGSPLDAPGFRLPISGWQSLWRGTDILGFPAYSNRPGENPVDLNTEEFDTTGYFAAVATHGEYFRSPVYQQALRRLVDGMDAGLTKAETTGPVTTPSPPVPASAGQSTA